MQVADSSIQEALHALDDLYRAIESKDAARVRAALRPDAFVLTPTADGVLTSADAVAEDINGWTRRVHGLLQLRDIRRAVGASPSGRAVWVFDELRAEAGSPAAGCSVSIRVTALLVSDDAWRVAAAYWSVPFPTQAAQDAVKHAGVLAPGIALEDSVGDGAAELVSALVRALAEPARLPALYSTGDSHVTIGSVADEIFLGAAGQTAWSEFVEHVTTFVPRGGVRAALAGPDAAWLATNIDVGSPPTPYRFFYIWVRQGDEWQIVVSHDGVSRDPMTA